MEEKQKAIEATNVIKEYCTTFTRCFECPFFGIDEDGNVCNLVDMAELPSGWKLPNLPTKQETPEIKNDVVNHPGHYTAGGVECIDALEAATVNLTGIEAVCTGNAIKYLWRWKLKNGVEDLKKAAWYLHKLIKRLDPTWRPEQ